MGWMTVTRDETSLVIGDGPLDLVGNMLGEFTAHYSEDLGRKPTPDELCYTIEMVLRGRVDELLEGCDGKDLSRLSIRFKPAKKAGARVGDCFSIPLRSGGYGYGQIAKVFRYPIILVRFLDTYSKSPLKASELSGASELMWHGTTIQAIENGTWTVIGNRPFHDATLTDAKEGELMRRYGYNGPATIAEATEELLRQRGRIE